ncbi:MAG: hypothetical protein Q9213_002183 [Squamulea squamosa]
MAAASNLYGAYYDLIHHGSLCRKVANLHHIYDNLLTVTRSNWRIAPNELHVEDIESYYKIIRVGTDFVKPWKFYNPRAIEGSLLNILDTPTARQRKEAYAHYFSQDAIAKIEPQIHQKVDQFLALLQRATKSHNPVDLSMGFLCLVADVIVDYAYREEFGGMSVEDFTHPLIEAGDSLLVWTQWGLYFCKFFTTLDVVTDWLPDKLLAWVSLQLMSIRNFQLV